MRLTARQLNRATLARQLLLRREPLTVEDATRRVVALQAQEPAGPYVALWNRVEGFDPHHLDVAFADGAVLKATLLRITLHAVHADDHPLFHAAMVPNLRAARLGDRRFAETGMTRAEADALVPGLLAFVAEEPRSRPDVEAWLADRLGDRAHPHVWWALRTFAPLVHAPADAPWSFGPRPLVRAAPPAERPVSTEAGLHHLVVRCLEGFGPARAEDIAQFTLQQRTVVRAALAALADRLVVRDGPDGAVLYDVPDAPLPDEDVPAPPRLLGMWDSVLLAYADRSRILPEPYRREVIRRNGDVLPTVLVDGHVRGVWRATPTGVEVAAFSPIDEDDWAGLDAEAHRLRTLVAGRDPEVFGRYRRWWDRLPAGERRMLGA